METSKNYRRVLFRFLWSFIALIGILVYFFIPQRLIVKPFPSSKSSILDPIEISKVNNSPNLDSKEEQTPKKPAFKYLASTFRNASMGSDTDIRKVQDLSLALVAGAEDDLLAAIRLFSQIGTPEQKAIIEEYARDQSKTIAVRLAAIENIDWDNNLSLLVNSIQGNDGIAEATLYIAATNELSKETRDELDKAAYFAFNQSSLPSTQVAILNYFFEQHSAKFDDLTNEISFVGYSPEEKEDVLNLLKQRKEEIRITWK